MIDRIDIVSWGRITFVDECQASLQSLVDGARDGEVVDEGLVVGHRTNFVIEDVALEVAGPAAT